MTSTKGILLDADGVVQLPGATWRTALEALCADPLQAEDFLADVFAAERPCLTGTRDFRTSLAEVLGRWQSSASVDEALDIWTCIEPVPEMLAVVASLRAAGTTVALATNQQAYRAHFMTHRLEYGRAFDHLLYSCHLGHAKPSPEYFSSALARIDMSPGDVLFIDDHEANVAAAQSCGLHAEVFHVCEGVGRLRDILERYGHGVAGL